MSAINSFRSSASSLQHMKPRCTCGVVRYASNIASTSEPRPADAMSPTITAAATPSVYPYSDSVTFPTQSSSNLPEDTLKTSAGAKAPLSLMDKVNRSLLLPSTSNFRSLFQRRSRDRIPSGSVIAVDSYTGITPGASSNTTTFAGMLMAVKRRHQGVDNAFRLRAIVGKPGVGAEVRFDVNSPWIKDVKVLKRSNDVRRAKLYYIRNSDKYLVGVQGAIKASRVAFAQDSVNSVTAARSAKESVKGKGKK